MQDLVLEASRIRNPCEFPVGKDDMQEVVESMLCDHTERYEDRETPASAQPEAAKEEVIQARARWRSGARVNRCREVVHEDGLLVQSKIRLAMILR
jgi:hypothetical protein